MPLSHMMARSASKAMVEATAVPQKPMLWPDASTLRPTPSKARPSSSSRPLMPLWPSARRPRAAACSSVARLADRWEATVTASPAASPARASLHWPTEEMVMPLALANSWESLMPAWRPWATPAKMLLSAPASPLPPEAVWAARLRESLTRATPLSTSVVSAVNWTS